MSDSRDTSTEPVAKARPVWLRGAALGGAAVAVVAAVLWFTAGPPGPESRSGPVPDFGAIEDVKAKKAAFFGFLAPMIDAHNDWILDNRSFLEAQRAAIAAGKAPRGKDRTRIEELAVRYRLPVEGDIDVALIDTLLFRGDVVPPSLALAQAASESAWGTSRFARQGNNYFGEWCFTADCGMVPAQRGSGKSHEVEVFDSVEASVDSYFRNLNQVSVYEPLRELRATAREAGRPIEGAALAAGLEKYSERGDEYIADLRSIISFNKLQAYDVALNGGGEEASPSG
ncbi:MAG TPA: glucosaminidase domain-containing protein [Pseudomonadales bacterium]|nr:glucosaminidase domain-containing protein [Pseudomonadales bacterium]